MRNMKEIIKIVKIFECPKCGFKGEIDERLNKCICGYKIEKELNKL
jgi:hypothetical protein